MSSRKIKIGGIMKKASEAISRTKKYKYDTTGNLVEITSTTTLSDNDIVVGGSKSSLRRIADLERNVSILATQLGTAGDNDADFDGTVNKSTKFKKNVQLGDGTGDDIIIKGTLDFSDGALHNDSKEVIMDIIGGMVSGNTESGITVTYDDSNNEFDFDITSAPKWETARTLSLTGDVTGSVSWDGSANATITTSIGNDSHNHTVSTISNFTEATQDLVGAMVSSNTESGITVSYDDTNGKLNFVVDYSAANAYADNYDEHLQGLSFNTANGELTADMRLGSDITVDLDGRYQLAGNYQPAGSYDNYVSWTARDHDGTSYTVTSGDVLQYKEGSGMDVNFTADDVLTFTNTDRGSSQNIFKNMTDGTNTATADSNNDTFTFAQNGGLTVVVDATNDKVTYSHADTSSQASVNNSGRTYIQDITLDAYGHITAIASATETVTDTWRGITSALDSESTTVSLSAKAGKDLNDRITGLIDGAPDALNTLNELAAALNDNSSFASSVTQSLSGKVATNSAQALHPTDALTVSNDTITLHKANGTSESVSISDANTWRPIHDTPVNGATTTSISSNWAFDNVKTAVPTGAVFTDTNTWRPISDTPGNDSATSISRKWAMNAFVGASVSNDTITFTKGDGTTTAVTTSDANTNKFINALAFNTSNGVLTATRNDGGTVTVDLDGRYTDNGYADTMNQHVRTTDSPTFAAVTATNFNGTATYAKYADLAERYAADAPYAEGTVVVFGGEAEVTASTSFAQRSVAGVVSLRPAVAMNAEAGNNETHPFIALQGRVPVKVTGDVKKGDILVASDVAGTATAWTNDDADPRMTAYVGIAISDAVDGFVEVKVGK